MLYDRYAAYLYGLCCRYVHDRSTAQDLMHDSMIRIYEVIGKWKPTGSLKSWISRIALNLVIDYLKKEKFLLYDDLSVVYNEREEDEVAAEDVKRLSFTEVLSLLERLSPAKRTIFNLYYVESCSHKEIAELLGIKEKTSSSILFKAREDLIGIIKKQNIK